MEFAQACKGLGRAGRSVGLGARPVANGARSFHLTLLVENATGWRNLCRLLTEAQPRTRAQQPDRDPLPPVAGARLAARAQRGPRLPLRLRARRGARRRLGARRAAPAPRRWRGGWSAAFGRERFRVELQRPLWRRDRARNRWLAGARRAARRRLRGDRQRPRPRPPPGRAPGRARRRAPAHDARGVRARAPRQHELGARPAGGDGGALRRASRGGRRDRAAGRAAALRPHLRARLPLPGLRGPRRRPHAWPRSAAAGSSSATRAPPSGPRPSGGSRRSCG